MIYKVFRENEYAELKNNGRTKGAPVDLQDGYIHFSTAEQLCETIAKHFQNAGSLYLLGVDETGLTNLKWEVSRGGALFPHLYDELDFDMVKTTAILTPPYTLPEGL